MLGLLVALAVVLGVAGQGGGHGEAVTTPVTAAASTHDSPATDDREHLCPAPRHDRCGADAVLGTPTTGPGPHPLPQALPARVDARPAAAPTAVPSRPGASRPPDLHMLQVLRT